ncbi:FAD-dependent oxidoreductase [Hyphobacterium sp. CCMP332]|nr:FAD-dependent oxidoreductase [Hyphobacterium sp. CCMP332]
MSKAIIFAIDDDPQVLKAIVRDLRGEFRKDYKILSTSSVEEALENISELKKRGENIALFISDQKMPEMQGVDFLEKAKLSYPDAKRVLLTAYSDIEAAIKAINDVQLDYYLMKPWDPPEEKMFPILQDLLDEWNSSIIPLYSGIKVIGKQWSSKSHSIKDFLSGNLIPYQWLPIEDNSLALELMEANNLNSENLPAVIMEDGELLVDPDLRSIASKTGRNIQAREELYDVVIIGAGPGGLAAGVYGGSEGLKTLLIEKHAPGGQAGTSSRIENYLGFPKGLSGAELSRRAVAQATRFGIEFLSPLEVKEIRIEGQYKFLKLNDDKEIKSKSVIIATGVSYKKLQVEGLDELTGLGVYYGAATTEANACKDQQVYIVGGGNSAGQGAMYLSKYAAKVHILIRKPDLSSSMSSYLIDQINETPNIEVIANSQISKAIGSENLEQLEIENLKDKSKKLHPAASLFIFIGAKPITDWLDDKIITNDKGFIETGRDLTKHKDYKKFWKKDREPYLLETCIPGIFAAGDVRAGAMNRVASAVGEGALAIKLVHEYLEEI